jgi:hypothetical protein
MDAMRDVGKLLLVFGLVLVALGVLLTLGPKLPGRLGRLPGDLVIRRENVTFYFPLVTCLLVSVMLSMILWLIGKMR